MATTAETFATALALHQARRLEQAEPLYREVLQADPRHAEALHCLGMLAHQAGRSDEALAAIQQAIALDPAAALYHYNLGAVYEALNRPAEAVACYSRAGQLQPADAECHSSLANALLNLNRVGEAEAHALRAVQLRPDLAVAHNNLGNALQRRGAVKEAARCYQQALRLNPAYAEAYFNLGLAAVKLGQLDDAARCLREALALSPNDPQILSNLGIVLHRQGQPHAALPYFQKAEACCREMLRRHPDAPESRVILGDVLIHLEQFEEAIAHLRQVLRLRPEAAEVHHDLGAALKAQGQRDEAVACFQRAIALRPDYVDAHVSLAHTWFLQGQYERAWPESEWRCRSELVRSHPQPRWDGSPLEGRTILLDAEQGLGDTLQFVRYARLVKERGGRVLLACHRPLLQLMATCPGVDQVVALGDPLPTFDVWVPLLSLPFLFGTTPDTVPAEIPYLAADPALVARWRKQLAGDDRFRVGIVWQGSRHYGADRWRSFPLAQFAPLAQVPGVRLLSLQKGDGREQLAQVSFPVEDLGARLDEATGPFLDTAAVMGALDLVITCDSATGHLAGALGVPFWVALAFDPHWPWLLEREDSPWYPTVRLFRQKKLGDWDDVFARIAEALRQYRNEHRP